MSYDTRLSLASQVYHAKQVGASLTTVIAVSYTHLDVYKRQVLEYHGGFLYVHLHRGDVVALFLEKGESRHATALTRSPKSF